MRFSLRASVPSQACPSVGPPGPSAGLDPFAMSETVPAEVIVGADTHKHAHSAVALTGLGARVAELTVKVGVGSYRELAAWARSLGEVRAFGIEGTGSCGAGLARLLCGEGHTVLI